MSHSLHILGRASLCLALMLWADAAAAMDGSTLSVSGDPIASAEPAPTYYEALLSSTPEAAYASTEPGLPTSLAIFDSSASLRYTRSGTRSWTLELRGLSRPHERVDAVYQMIAVLPLPVWGDGSEAFRTRSLGIRPREGTESSSVPLIYGGEKIVLKRNITLEKALLPGIVGADFGKLPSLAGTGYDYTLWDTIVRHDAGFGDIVHVFADVPYLADPAVSPPDGADERLKAYILTWIPGMDPSQPIFSIRIDVEDPLPIDQN